MSAWMIDWRLAVAGLALGLALGAQAQAGAREDFHKLLADYDAWTDQAHPFDAGQRGDLSAAARWPDVSPEGQANATRQLEILHTRLKAIAPEKLSPADALNHVLLDRRLEIDLAGARFDEARIPFVNDGGFYSMPQWASQGTRITNEAQAEAHLARMAALPDFYDAEIANLRRGIATGWVQPKRIAELALAQVQAQVDTAPDRHVMLRPLRTLAVAIPEETRAAWLERGIAIVKTRIKPAETKLRDFFRDTYIPKARETIGASDMPDGRAYYAYRVKRETTTDLTPDEIYALGQKEVARIRADMTKVIGEANFTGSFAEFLAFLRKDPQFYVTTREALLEKASRLAKRIDDQLPGFFNLLPRLPYGVRPVQAEIEEGYTSGRYNSGSPEQGIAGGLMINTSHLDMRPLYELPALVAHEGVPGHHLQIALGQELKGVPQFRRHDSVTAFVEGWALYSERIAGEMGLYGTPYERFGALSMEMWRACRLVMDVGIHWKGVSREDALSCLRENSALSEANIQSETDRYISWPGQALAYKIGQLKILDLRAKAEAALGPAFDKRRFHAVVLNEGAMPLSILEKRVNAWIKAGGKD